MLKAGILGGGQLGRMLLQAAANYPVETFVLENDEQAPAAHLCHHFIKGDIRDFDAVYNFGKMVDALTIEIENVNIEALQRLESEGVLIYPKPAVLRTIKNKILQKQYYAQHHIPTTAFTITQSKEDLKGKETFLPAVHKLAEGGYDGRGVQLMHNAGQMEKGFDAPSVLEKMISIKKEIAQMVAVDVEGNMALYPPVEMVFDAALNLLDYQLCPANIDDAVLQNVQSIAKDVVRHFNSPGLFAVELLIDEQDTVWVNETAPRVHNSGHHTIEAHYSSQFDMLWRILLQYPLGNTAALYPSVMVNVIGAEGYSGAVKYEGLKNILQNGNAFVHLYGKAQTKPGRKMGHITFVGPNLNMLTEQAHYAKETLKVVN
jgi:5-(carboxyamino)imidazole ribonucleotide synthase